MPTLHDPRSPFALATATIPKSSVLCRLTIHGDPKKDSIGLYGPGPRSIRKQQVRARIQNLLMAAYPFFAINRTHDLGISIAVYTKTRQRRDLDNMIKMICDACTQLIWGDDLQLCEVVSHTYRGHDGPRIHFIVYTIGASYQKFCEICQTPLINARKTIVRSPNARFCSKACYDEAQRKGKYVYCSTCSKRLYRQQHALTQHNWYCSTECRSIGIRGTRLCKQCSQPFFIPGSRSTFCSDTCRRAWHAKPRDASQRTGQCPACGTPSIKKHGRSAYCQPCFVARRREAHKTRVLAGTCKRGHPRTPENTVLYRGKIHYCRLCRQEARRSPDVERSTP